MAGPRDEKAAAATGRSHLRTSHADREQTIDTLKAAFVQDRLTKDEFDARIGQTLTARTHAELAAVTSDIPAGLAGARRPRTPHRVRVSNAAKWAHPGSLRPLFLPPLLHSFRCAVTADMALWPLLLHSFIS
jgi:uncharacterized protein DUF1707